MALPNINKLSYGELKDLQDQIVLVKAAKQREAKADVKEKIKALAAESGFDLAELLDGRGARNRQLRGSKIAPKYRHPKDPSLTWTGRGRQPRWLVSELQAGKKLKSFLIA